MEDRKRPAAENNESAPPLKKQATTVNGGSKPHPDADMPWKDDLEVSDQISGFFGTLAEARTEPAFQGYHTDRPFLIAFPKRRDPSPNARIQARESWVRVALGSDVQSSCPS